MSGGNKSAYDARMLAQEAREAFPEYFTGKTDEEVIHEILAALKRVTA